MADLGGFAAAGGHAAVFRRIRATQNRADGAAVRDWPGAAGHLRGNPARLPPGLAGGCRLRVAPAVRHRQFPRAPARLDHPRPARADAAVPGHRGRLHPAAEAARDRDRLQPDHLAARCGQPVPALHAGCRPPVRPERWRLGRGRVCDVPAGAGAAVHAAGTASGHPARRPLAACRGGSGRTVWRGADPEPWPAAVVRPDLPWPDAVVCHALAALAPHAGAVHGDRARHAGSHRNPAP